MHHLRRVGDEVHLDAGRRLVVEGDVPEGRGAEVGVRAVVDDVEDVPVELPGDAARVVVGGFEHRDVLDEVEAEEKAILPAAEERAHPGEQPQPGRRVEVADRAPEEEHEAAADRGGHVLQVPLEVTHEGAHVEERVVGNEAGRAGLHGQLVDVDRNVAQAIREAVPAVEEPAGLRRRSRTELYDVLGLQLAHEPWRERVEERRFRPRQVVLGKLGDVFEQIGSDDIVEVLRRQGLGACREPAAHVFLEPCAPVGFVRIRVRAIAHGRRPAVGGMWRPPPRNFEGRLPRVDSQALLEMPDWGPALSVAVGPIPTYTSWQCSLGP